MDNTIDFKNKLTIGVIDSGVGGLSVLSPLVKAASMLDSTLRPRFIYLADTLRFPYGQRPKAQIQEFSMQMIKWLEAKHCQATVIACHTISTAGASDQLQSPMKICDMGQMGSWLSLADAKTIAVLSTPATASTLAINKSIAANHPSSSVLEIGCPELASIIEQGIDSSDQLQKILNSYAEQIMQAHADTVVLGCTHYPFIAGMLAQLLPKQVKIVDPAIQFAGYFFEQLGLKLQPSQTNSDIEIAFHVSGSVSQFRSKLNIYVPDLSGNVAPVTVEELEAFSASKLPPSRLMWA